MTAGDGDAEQLRVPRWIGQPDSSEDEPGYGSDGAEPAVRHGRDPDDDEDEGEYEDEYEDSPNIYVPRRYSNEADDDAYDPDFEDEIAAISAIDAGRPGRRAAWKETLPSGERFDDDRPAGRRHAATPRNRRLVIAWVAAAVVIAVALPLGVLFFSSSKGANVGANGQRTPPRTEAPPSVDGVSIPGTQSGAASPSDVQPTGRSNAAPNPGKFGPVTYEAEGNSNKLSGSASVIAYPGASGGSIVRNIGDWGIAGGPGTLRFENVEVPVAGSYALTFFHVNIDNERLRTAVVTVDGVDPILVTITGSSTCCLSTTIRVTLKQGRNTITFSNNSAHAPSIDKITIGQP